GELRALARRELELEDRAEAEAVVALRAEDPDLAVQRDVAEALVVEAVREGRGLVVVEAGDGQVRPAADRDRDLHADDQEVREAEVEMQDAGELRVDDATAEQTVTPPAVVRFVRRHRAVVDEAGERQDPEAAVEEEAEADPEVREHVGAV